MAKSADRWTAERELRPMRKCVKDADHAAEILAELEQELAAEPLEAWKLTFALNNHAAIPASRGAVAVYEGNADGWADLEVARRRMLVNVAWMIHRFDARLLVVRGGPLPLDHTDLQGAVRQLLWAMAVGDDAATHLFGGRLAANLTDGDRMFDNPGQAWSLDPTDTFAVALYALWTGRGSANISAALKPKKYFHKNDDAHRRALESGAQGEGLAEALDDMVAFRSRCSGKDYFNLDFFPVGLFPVEFVALERVRAAKGWATPRPSHPLLNSPLMDPPKMPAIVDEITDRVVRRLRDASPSFAVPWSVKG